MSITTPKGALRTIPDGSPLTYAEVQNLGHYAKIIAYIVITVLSVLATASHLNAVIVINAIIAGLGIIPIYFTTKRFALKAVVAGAIAALQALVALLAAGWDISAISWQEWIGIILAGVAAAGVGIVPNGAATAITLHPAAGVASPSDVPVAPGVNIGTDHIQTSQVQSVEDFRAEHGI